MRQSRAGSKSSIVDYGSHQYWEERYSTKRDNENRHNLRNESSFFDWYQDYSTLRQHIKPYLEAVGQKLSSNRSRKYKDIEILIPGCGNSADLIAVTMLYTTSGLGYSLYQEGYRNISNIDISPSVIRQMIQMQNTRRATEGANAGGDDSDDIDYAVMDALHMSAIPDNCFDLIIDKGLLDSQLCAETNIDDVTTLVKEMYRVLSPGGIYLVISHGGPGARLRYLFPSSSLTPASYGLEWTVDYLPMLKPEFYRPLTASKGSPTMTAPSSDPSQNHFMYVCKKR